MSSNSSEPKAYGGSGSGNGKAKRSDPVLDLLRFSVHPREYELLHKYLLSHTPVVNGSLPAPVKLRRAIKESDDYNASTVRLALRVGAATLSALKIWENVAPRLFAGGRSIP